MSVRVYTGPHTSRAPSRTTISRWLPWILALAGLVAQIAWPLASGSRRDALTVASVLLFLAALATHALVVRGPLWTLGWLVAGAGVGFAAEVVGTRSGLPFGSYTYSDRLGPAVLGVPLLIAAAWAMISYPALLAARSLVRSGPATAFVGAWLVMSWDLFLDPQMVAEGHWSWSVVDPHLPGIPLVPLQNFVGWLLVGFVLMLLLGLLPRTRNDGDMPPDGLPATVLIWFWLSNIGLAAVIAGRPGAALWGGIAMGLVVVPYLVRSWFGRE